MGAPLFEPRHYVKIAEIIKSIGPGGARAEVADFFASALIGTNPNYNRRRFYLAAIGAPIIGPPSRTTKIGAGIS